MRTATIMIGPSGSGKSTFVREHCRRATLVCSADDYFCKGGEYEFNPVMLSAAHDACLRDFVRACINQSDDVVCDNTNTTIDQVAPYIRVAQACGYRVNVVVCLATLKDCGVRNVHGVPDYVIARQLNQVQDLLNHWPRYWPKYIHHRGVIK